MKLLLRRRIRACPLRCALSGSSTYACGALGRAL
jgi:hypothetical protein